jgi:hypothetical protein
MFLDTINCVVDIIRSMYRNPSECALFYLALDKKPALAALYKAVRDQTLFDFLKNDFNQEKWKTAGKILQLKDYSIDLFLS